MVPQAQPQQFWLQQCLASFDRAEKERKQWLGSSSCVNPKQCTCKRKAKKQKGGAHAYKLSRSLLKALKSYRAGYCPETILSSISSSNSSTNAPSKEKKEVEQGSKKRGRHRQTVHTAGTRPPSVHATPAASLPLVHDNDQWLPERWSSTTLVGTRGAREQASHPLASYAGERKRAVPERQG